MAISRHLAISLDDIFDLCRKDNTSINEAYSKYFKLLNNLLQLQVKSNIPIFTVYLLPVDAEKYGDDFLIFSEHMADFFNGLPGNPIISEQKIKVSIFGKWYKLPSKSIDALKRMIDDTKEYDNFFVNFCINYDGHEEIVDACKLIAKQVELGKIAPEMITKENIKENLYSSYFLAPDIVLIYGERKLSGLLLWDSAKSRIVFAGKSFMEFEESDLNLVRPHL